MQKPLMTIPIGDIIDRITILTLKLQRLPRDDTINELYSLYTATIIDILREQGSEFVSKVETLQKQLYEANKCTWNLEHDIRLGKLDNNLEEIGRRAIAIRESNKERIAIKNKINELFGEIHGIDIKVDHLSE